MGDRHFACKHIFSTWCFSLHILTVTCSLILEREALRDVFDVSDCYAWSKHIDDVQIQVASKPLSKYMYFRIQCMIVFQFSLSIHLSYIVVFIMANRCIYSV